VLLFLFFATLRPLGLLFGFSAFAWGMGGGLVLRTGIGIALGLPMALGALDEVISVIDRNSLPEMIILLPKEMIIGFALGIFASLPFFALKYAGEIADNFRGESNSGLTDPSDSSITSLGLVFLLIGFFIFFGSGGLWQLVGMLYQSYGIWPLSEPLPALSAGSALKMVGLVTSSLLNAGIIVAPLMILMLAIEFIIIIAARIAKRFDLSSNEFALKNLAVILVMPVVVIYVAQVTDVQIMDSFMALLVLGEVLP
jgi:type III secretion protein T